MNISKGLWQLMIVVVAFVAGAATMQVWHMHLARRDTALLATLEDSPSVWMLDMERASSPAGEQARPERPEPVAAPENSQLSKIDVPEIQTIITRSGDTFSPAEPETVAPVTLPENARTGGLAAAPAQTQAPASESKISLIEAPVEATLIKSLDEYRQFKRRARGSYPEADFNTQHVLVLESTSNLPDKVFEIIAVKDAADKRVVTYRVSVFGLDKKTNTHSVALVDKSDLPLELKQVL